jgi:hypothetical protein
MYASMTTCWRELLKRKTSIFYVPQIAFEFPSFISFPLNIQSINIEKYFAHEKNRSYSATSH